MVYEERTWRKIEKKKKNINRKLSGLDVWKTRKFDAYVTQYQNTIEKPKRTGILLYLAEHYTIKTDDDHH